MAHYGLQRTMASIVLMGSIWKYIHASRDFPEIIEIVFLQTVRDKYGARSPKLNIGLEIIDQLSKTLKHLGRSEGLRISYVTGIMEDQKGRIWISTENGLNVLNEKKGTIRSIKNENGLIENCVRCMMEDQEGNIWLGMNEKGIDILDEKSGKILHLDSSTGLQGNKLRAL